MCILSQSKFKYTHIYLWKRYIYIYPSSISLPPSPTTLSLYFSFQTFPKGCLYSPFPFQFSFPSSVHFSLASAPSHNQPCSYQGYIIKSTEYLPVFIALDLSAAFDTTDLFKTLSHWSLKFHIFRCLLSLYRMCGLSAAPPQSSFQNLLCFSLFYHFLEPIYTQWLWL